MKVLVISHMYPSTPNPAYGIFVHKQVMALKDQGLQVKVLSPVPYAPWPLSVMKNKWKSYAAIPKKDVIGGVETFYPRYPEFPRSYFLEHSGFLMYLGMRRLVEHIYKEFPFDLIHAHVALPDGHAAFELKKKYRVPVIVTVHGQDFQSTLHKGERCRERLFQVLGGADGIMTVSTKLKKMVQGAPFFDKISVVNNGIDLEDCNPSENQEPQAPGDRTSGDRAIRKMISVSNLKKTKGIDLNLQALASLVRKYPDLRYTIVGDGEERQNLEKLTDQLGLRDHVEFLGKLSHPETMKQMAAADVFSLPSWQEGFGVVYIEAMAQGLPVVGVQGEGIEDVIRSGQNGLLVQPKNVEELTGALDSLIRDPHYAKKLAETGRESVFGGYTWKYNAAKTLSLYQQLLRQVHPSR